MDTKKVTREAIIENAEKYGLKVSFNDSKELTLNGESVILEDLFSDLLDEEHVFENEKETFKLDMKIKKKKKTISVTGMEQMYEVDNLGAA